MAVETVRVEVRLTPAPDDTAAPWTPGPWRSDETEPPGQWVIHSKTAFGPGERQHRKVGYALTEANARVMAAAPSLYEALDHVEAVMSIVQPRGHTKEYLET